MLLPIFRSPHKKNTKKLKKYIRKKKNSSEKRILKCLENGKKLVEEVKKYKDWNLIVYFWLMRALLTKKIQFEEEKSKFRCLYTWLNFIEGLMEFMEGLITRKK
jgi:hypothetical protein